MADVRFTALAVVTAFRSGDVLAVDNPGPGSAQINVINANGGRLLGYGVTAIPNSVNPTITLGVILAAVPDWIEVSFMCPGGAGAGSYMIAGCVDASSMTTTQFNLQLLGAPGDTSHEVIWKAYAAS